MVADMAADKEVYMVADMEVDKVTDRVVAMVADMAADKKSLLDAQASHSTYPLVSPPICSSYFWVSILSASLTPHRGRGGE